ncbi:MAG: ATP synthase F1 subunit epsilon [Patescibacteria group bacterium]
MKIHFKIVTPERTVFEDEIDQATLPVTDGEVTILPNHTSYIASLKAGEICLKKGGEEIILATSGGFVEFDKNNLVLLADTAERVEEIDLKAAEEAKKRAEELMKARISMDDEEYAKVAAAIERESARIKIARKHHTRRGISIE